ncbi:hypothetical protein GGF46_001850 [Coemansia sp. RSA 552]|nr:hypothetical protein GGF46_001850 [Coemansia sp. RSA 552]
MFSNGPPSTDTQAFESPMLLNSVGITPAQSIQSLQINDLNADALAAGFAAPCSVPSNAEVPMTAADINQATFASLLNGPQLTQQPFSASSSAFDLSMTSAPTTNGFLKLNEDAFGQFGGNSLLGKRKSEDEDGLAMPMPVGVRLGKRVSMPASYGNSLNPASVMPLPSGATMQRIASYNSAGSFGSFETGSSSDPMAGLGKNPITRVKTTSAIGTTTGATNPTMYQRKVAHNAIERRYRNNINDRICDLRNSVPALQHIRPKKKSGHDADSDDDDSNQDNQVDGVEAATKLNKATILGKSTEYIYYLRRTNDLLKRESMYLQEMIRKLPDGDKMVQKLLKRAQDESRIATAGLCMPESALQPRKKTKRH